MAFTTPGTAVAGDVLTAAFWNSNVRDNFNDHEIYVAPFRSAQATYTPTLDQNGARAKTVNRAAWTKIGYLVFGLVTMTITATGSAGTPIFSSLPTTSGNTISASGSGADAVGAFAYLASGGARYSGTATWDSNNGRLFFVATGATGFGALGSSPSFATSNTDILTFTFQYYTSSLT
jgi:hypothetical protein